jgi:hypothetical protein
MDPDNGTITGWKQLNVDVRAEWQQAGVGVVDMTYEEESWMGSTTGSHGWIGPYNLSAFALKWKRVASEFPARAVWDSSFSYIELFNEPDALPTLPGTGDQYMAAAQATKYGLVAGQQILSSSQNVTGGGGGVGGGGGGRGGGSNGSNHPIKLLCGVVTDSVHDGWRDAAADNGLFEVCDGLSFHSYRDPADEEKLVAVFRNWLAFRGQPDFPLLVTESGSQADVWKSQTKQPCSGKGVVAAAPVCPTGYFCDDGVCKGKMRPTFEEDLIYAWDIVAKAIEHKALGIDASFAFILFYYSESKGSFSITGRDGTALRALAALAQAISVLSNAKYVGDLPNTGSRVFNTTTDGLVAVIMGAKPGSASGSSLGSALPPAAGEETTQAHWSWYYPVKKFEGIDGRALSVHCYYDSGCQYEGVPDGLTYLYLDDSAYQVLQRHTVATQLTNLSNAHTPSPQSQSQERTSSPPPPPTSPPLPVVMRYRWDPTHVQVLSGTSTIGSAWGYHVSPGNASALTFTVAVHSLAADPTAPPVHAVLTLQVGRAAGNNRYTVGSRDTKRDREGATQVVDIGPMQVANVTWTVDLTEYAGSAAELVVTCTDGADITSTAKQSTANTGGGGDTHVVGNGTLLAIPLQIKLDLSKWGCLAQDDAPCPGAECNYCGE